MSPSIFVDEGVLVRWDLDFTPELMLHIILWDLKFGGGSIMSWDCFYAGVFDEYVGSFVNVLQEIWV